MQPFWDGCSVPWSNDGCSQQCVVSGSIGILMSEADVLGIILPAVLSAGQVKFADVLESVGEPLKKSATKSTGYSMDALWSRCSGAFLGVGRQRGFLSQSQLPREHIISSFLSRGARKYFCRRIFRISGAPTSSLPSQVPSMIRSQKRMNALLKQTGVPGGGRNPAVFRQPLDRPVAQSVAEFQEASSNSSAWQACLR